MITTKKYVGGRCKGGPFLSTARLRSIKKEASLEWTISNSKSSFTFTEDSITGVYLSSWKPTDSDDSFTNY